MIEIKDSYGLSDTGRQRQINEDSLLIDSPLFVVADGMGGASAGEVASRLATTVVSEGNVSASSVAEDLRSLVLLANKRINSQAQSSPEQEGMGTTLTGVYIDSERARMTVVHVGDSRAYLLRGGQLQRLTEDHSLVEELLRRGQLTPQEAEVHPQRSIITRALGPEVEVEVDIESVQLQEGDRILLCSDGLTTMLSETEIAGVMQSKGSLKSVAESLVSRANSAGGRDNITVALVQIDGEAAAPTVQEAAKERAQGVDTEPIAVSDAKLAKKRASGGKFRRALKYLAVTGVLLTPFIIGGVFATRAVYFVGSDRGFVTLYQGVPYELPFGIKLYQVNYRSGVSTNLVTPSRRDQILDHRLRSYDDATDLVRQIERSQIIEKRQSSR